MTRISCTIRDDAVWSDGTRIKSDDIIATINTFRKSAQNEDMRSFLETVKITKNGDTIEISSSQKNPLMSDILTYPIVKSGSIDAIQNGTIEAKNYVTSGPYIFGETVTDKEYGFDRITLNRNEK